MMKSLPGMCGKPRKFSALANFSRQVANWRSHPAVMVKVSPAAMGAGAGVAVAEAAAAAAAVVILRPSLWLPVLLLLLGTALLCYQRGKLLRGLTLSGVLVV